MLKNAVISVTIKLCHQSASYDKMDEPDCLPAFNLISPKVVHIVTRVS